MLFGVCVRRARVRVCLCVYLCVLDVYVGMHTMAHIWRAEDNFVEPVLIFHVYIGSWDPNHITSLVWQVPHTRSRLWPMVVHFLFLYSLLFFFSFLFLLTYFIERDLLCIPRLSRQGWPGTHRNSTTSASASLVLGLKACVTHTARSHLSGP